MDLDKLNVALAHLEVLQQHPSNSSLLRATHIAFQDLHMHHRGRIMKDFVELASQYDKPPSSPHPPRPNSLLLQTQQSSSQQELHFPTHAHNAHNAHNHATATAINSTNSSSSPSFVAITPITSSRRIRKGDACWKVITDQDIRVQCVAKQLYMELCIARDTQLQMWRSGIWQVLLAIGAALIVALNARF